MQHHAFARLAWPFATVRSAPRRVLHQTGRVQLRLRPGVPPPEPMLLPDVLVKMLHVPAQVMRAVFAQHPHQLVDRHPTHRRLAEAAIGKSANPILLVAPTVPPKLPLRASQKLASLHRR